MPQAQDLWIDTPLGALYACRWQPAGAAPARAPIVLFHDSLGCVALWRDFPARLCAATGRAVLAYDRLGFGRSAPRGDALALDFVPAEAAQVLPLLRAACGVPRFVAMGHSVGGGMAAHAAAQAGPACVALVTESAQCFVEPRTLAGIRAAEAAFTDPAEMQRLARHHGERAPWVLQAWTRTWLSPAFADYSLEPALAAVRCPTLVLHGEEDEYVTPRQPGRIAASVAGPAELALLPGCRHVPHREQPEVVLARIAAFLQALP